VEHLAEIIKSVSRKKNLNLSREAREIERQWAIVAGPLAAAHSWPQGIKNETLRVGVDSSVWLQHLRLLQPDLLDKIRVEYPELKIREIRITLLPALPTQTRNRVRGSGADLRHLTHRDKKMIESCPQAIADTELAALFRRIMTLEIARRRTREAHSQDRQQK
jgi:hypothetical protein